ncbi:SIR2 family NAD-dependent protein deacylase [Flavihumibacter petaseus]|uniref:protein acetyllysine N-acetyltransferase n=1 Tax=Flavihumibacter petaseus NBRC 106054 TaxID=1220578 RepID=A0A0E9N8C1_9BACT|nr:Sir2 family NAD-dependent protein deacetylase [Flavihumibacter petaseus]GAO45635.1 NAD-dependent protein deacylase [Flavihumibacter petaseus NBRC 106054]
MGGMKKRLVVLTGAGISAESGLKTFRDSDGLWEGYAIEDVATPRAWGKNPELVLSFYNERRRNVLGASPNAAHIGLAALEEFFEVQIITQNIDDLHERGGSSSVLHLHGEIFGRKSDRDGWLKDRITGDMLPGDLAPDGGVWRPDIVWFEEPVPLIIEAAEIVRAADIFVVVGTSLVVYPAAGLVDYVQPDVTVYVVDRKLPLISRPGVRSIEAPATEGVAKLKELLLADLF